MDDFEKRDAENKIVESEKTVDKLKTLFKNSRIKTDITWKQIQLLMKENLVFKNSEPLDQLKAFREYIEDTTKSELLRKKKKTERQERINREVFSLFLKNAVEEGVISHKTKWHEFAT